MSIVCPIAGEFSENLQQRSLVLNRKKHIIHGTPDNYEHLAQMSVHYGIIFIILENSRDLRWHGQFDLLLLLFP